MSAPPNVQFEGVPLAMVMVPRDAPRLVEDQDAGLRGDVEVPGKVDRHAVAAVGIDDLRERPGEGAVGVEAGGEDAPVTVVDHVEGVFRPARARCRSAC